MGSKSNRVGKKRAELAKQGIIVEVPNYNTSIPEDYNFTFLTVKHLQVHAKRRRSFRGEK